ncbi:RIP metalloprotease RseP, partial [Vibrio parahaemolyticus V-223/04]
FVTGNLIQKPNLRCIHLALLLIHQKSIALLSKFLKTVQPRKQVCFQKMKLSRLVVSLSMTGNKS